AGAAALSALTPLHVGVAGLVSAAHSHGRRASRSRKTRHVQRATCGFEVNPSDARFNRWAAGPDTKRHTCVVFDRLLCGRGKDHMAGIAEMAPAASSRQG